MGFVMSDKNINLEFGQKITITHKYRRKVKSIPRENDRYHMIDQWKTWEPMPFESIGIFLGFRTLSNDIREHDSYYGYYFNPKEHFKAALVCPGPNLNSVYVPLDSIE
jgi:hypothetical protein